MIRLFLFASLFICISANGQNSIITGIVIDQNMKPLHGIMIFTLDNIKLGSTDGQGKFQVDATSIVKGLIFEGVGMEAIKLHLIDSCYKLELVMLYASTYDFISLEEVDILRKKEFKKLPKLHKKAFESGIFESEKACFKQVFLSSYVPKDNDAS